MKSIYLIIDANFGDQGVDVVCASENRELLEKKLDILNKKFRKEYRFESAYEIIDLQILENEDDL